MDFVQKTAQQLAEKWRTSLQVRVIGSILVSSTLVVLILGLTLISIVAQRLVDSKLETASNEIDRARAVVERQIATSAPSNSLQSRLNSARASLTNYTTSGNTETIYEPVLVVENPDGQVTSSPEGYEIPARLRFFVSQGQVSYQFATFNKPDGGAYKALVIGSPTNADISGLQIYLVMPLVSEESTLALIRGLFAAGGVVLLVLIVGIAWLLTQQVTAPVRSASRIAERFAAGHRRERMVVEGSDEMARLALSFNAMAESLSKQIDQLEEYGDLQRQFTSDVSHELRTPLTTVRMAADMIADNADELDPYTKRASELMVRELDRFEALLADLLEISRHDAGVADLSEEQVDIRACITAAWQQVQHLAEKLNVDVKFELPEQPVNVVIDSRRIERILRNLIANAIDHSEGKPINVQLATSDDAVAIAVTDHGVGLKPGQEELVFNRFWRADPSRKRHSGGTGLGLAISSEDASLHGGALEASGELGIGSRFRLTLPVRPGQPYQESPIPLIHPDVVAIETAEDEGMILIPVSHHHDVDKAKED
ncbi:MtrAB system histidine kinase MtrB [Corynebacterium epidermidicanis]|uniref:Sensor histidine kinase MtrB n=1 Tax=Corynebacterium epidermidicanis TaxID=1050174 RepID=A0A0G3GSJ7_9CORY|nr:MtrAB system histidine kinase MtrB [Corynebacterium epidermidicanis]AKK02533.1 signal transduction histidine kinase [Corynebacterium epidermidicanis]